MIARYVLPVLVILAGLWCSDAAPAQRASSFIASPGELSKRAKRESPPVLPIEDVPLKIREMQVSSSVTARFTKTVVECTVANDAHQSQEVNFYMELPKEAFISGFLIEADSVVYNSRVEEKEAAQQAYDHAKSQGQTTGQVKQSSEEKNDFTLSINVEALSELKFNLTFEELLKRKDGYFENVISISPGQTVEHLVVDVHIIEPQGIQEESVDFFVKKFSPDGTAEVQRPDWALVKGLKSDQVSVQFFPTPEQQEALSASGNLGKFIVRYDVIHGQDAGDIQIVNGYFVHHFSPEGFKPTQKSVVFVLDTSGSMSGTKIRQTKEAMDTILSDLREMDEFGIITFSSSTRAWRPSMVPSTKDNIKSAKDHIQGLQAGGGTNLHGGIVDAIAMLKEAQGNSLSTVGKFYLIIMLTDGVPTAGRLTEPEGIKADIRRQLEGRFSLFSLGFGEGVRYPFLEELSLQTKGLARKIYADSDAGLQLVGFFDEVATPLLVNIQIKYDENMVVTNSISETNFPAYFVGTELVVAGKLVANNIVPNMLTCVVIAETGGVEIELEVEVNVQEESLGVLSPNAVDDFAQRLWAFLTIKELLQRRIAAQTDEEKNALTERALELSLKYHFVTPLTSLVVVKPNEDEPILPVVDPRVYHEETVHRSQYRVPPPVRQPKQTPFSWRRHCLPGILRHFHLSGSSSSRSYCSPGAFGRYHYSGDYLRRGWPYHRGMPLPTQRPVMRKATTTVPTKTTAKTTAPVTTTATPRVSITTTQSTTFLRKATTTVPTKITATTTAPVTTTATPRASITTTQSTTWPYSWRRYCWPGPLEHYLHSGDYLMGAPFRFSWRRHCLSGPLEHYHHSAWPYDRGIPLPIRRPVMRKATTTVPTKTTATTTAPVTTSATPRASITTAQSTTFMRKATTTVLTKTTAITTAPVTTTATPRVSITTTQSTTSSESQPKYRATFVMYKEGRDDAQLCFSVKAKPSQIYTLLSDKNGEIEVNGCMASSVVASTELSESETVPLILDRLLVKVREGNLEVSPDSLLLGSTLTMPWGQNWKARVQGMRVAVRSGSHLSIQLSSQLTLVIHRHTGDPSAHKNDFLGLEIRNADGFSQEVDGIIGQFERREIHLDAGSITGEGASMRGQLIVGSQRLEVRQSERMDIREERARQCWWYAGGDEVLEKSLRQYRARQ